MLWTRYVMHGLVPEHDVHGITRKWLRFKIRNMLAQTVQASLPSDALCLGDRTRRDVVGVNLLDQQA